MRVFGIICEYNPFHRGHKWQIDELRRLAGEEEYAVEPEALDEELNRIVGIFKLAREQGYTLKLIPGTPEENAPVFDFEHERILHNAA